MDELRQYLDSPTFSTLLSSFRAAALNMPHVCQGNGDMEQKYYRIANAVGAARKQFKNGKYGVSFERDILCLKSRLSELKEYSKNITEAMNGLPLD